ncbi:MAG: hypothetical protein QG644_487 [Patescibacteria group bacterium]|nr:hypothetical protein [Patescibacteria group bacterium]
MFAFNFEIQAMGRMYASLCMPVSKPCISKEEEPKDTLFETYSEETSAGVEHFFRSTDADDNGAGWDNRLGK